MMSLRLAAHFFFFVILMSFGVCCQNFRPAPAYQQTSQGILLDMEGYNPTRKIRFQLIDTGIIRVTATPLDSFLRKGSLLKPRPFEEWTASQKGKTVIINTPAVRVKVSTLSGAVRFEDRTGKILLAEPIDGGKSYGITDLNKKNYWIRQIFNSPEEEEFYLTAKKKENIKGRDLDFTRQLPDSVLPLVFSSNNYGLLWNNSSSALFGDPRAYRSMRELDLYGKNGEGGGLLLTCYKDDRLLSQKQINDIDFRYSEKTGDQKIPEETTKVILEGFFSSPIEGDHKFRLQGSGRLQLWVDEALIIEGRGKKQKFWRENFTHSIKKGEKQSIRLEWIPEKKEMSLQHLNPLPGRARQQLWLSSESGMEIDYYFIQFPDHIYPTTLPNLPLIIWPF